MPMDIFTRTKVLQNCPAQSAMFRTSRILQAQTTKWQTQLPLPANFLMWTMPITLPLQRQESSKPYGSIFQYQNITSKSYSRTFEHKCRLTPTRSLHCSVSLYENWVPDSLLKCFALLISGQAGDFWGQVTVP